MNLARSFSDSLQRHRDTFAQAEQYLPQALALQQAITRCLKRGGKVVFMGNGGSAADSQHLAAEFMVRYKQERRPLASLALTTDTSILTAHANDYDFSTVFERQVQGLVKPEDVVIGLTTSGTSRNINLALQAAKDIGAFAVALTGRDGGQVVHIADLAIVVKSQETARIQEMHMFIGHWLCEAMDLEFAQATA
jgi:D-sedoheptulose 7-phosphate isomerase